MNPQENQPNSQLAAPQLDYSQPIGYDTNGRPLYAHPPQNTPAPAGVQHNVVHVMRPLSPEAPVISEQQKARHEDSKRRYPMLRLSTGEFVISAIYRHPIGLISIWLVWGGLTVILLASALAIAAEQITVEMGEVSSRAVGMMALGASVVTFMVGIIATIIYRGNKFFLTNESVIQFIQTGLFHHQSQSISLENIEDASYVQTGVMQHMFNYGSLRLSTEGDETTYRFIYVAQPEEQVGLLNDAVEAFKNGRPLSGDGSDD